MFNKKWLKGSKNLFEMFKVMEYKRNFKRQHPDYFDPDGIIMFCGVQGSGKTLSAVQYVQKLSYLYPKCIICTNTDIVCNPDSKVIRYNGLSSLTNVQNGEHGVIYLIDEIQLEFNSLESKNIPVSVFTEITQQRKQRKHIVCTSQVFGRVAKPFREQCRFIVACRCLLGLAQWNILLDGNSVTEVEGEVKARRLKGYFWFHTVGMYNSYDTYSKIYRYRKEWNAEGVK